MAERAELSMQLRIDEFEEIRRVGLLNETEFRELRIKRHEFENKLSGVMRDLKYYLNYINFEEDLLKLIRLRRDKHKIGEKKGSIDYRIIKKIKELYLDAIRCAPDNYDVCVKYYMFCTRNTQPATEAVERLLRLHPGKEQTWNLAAGWYAKGEKDIKRGLKILLKGLELHPDSQLLYKQAINLQLRIAQSDLKQCEKESPNELENKGKKYVEEVNEFVEVVFKNIKKFNFYFELLELFEPYKFVGSIKEQVLQKILQDYWHEPLVWHNLAQRCQRGLDETTETDPKIRLRACISKYMEGLDKIPQDKKRQLWALFLDYLIQSYERKKVTIQDLNEHLSRAHEHRCLPERFYDNWLERNKNDFGVEILKKATEAYPRSEKWHELYLKYKISKHAPVEDLSVIFSRGKDALGDKAVNLWTMFIQYHIVTSSDDVVQNYFLKGIRESEKISLALRPLYLEWLRLTKSIVDIRRAYKELSQMRPFCKRLHMIMLSIETVELDVNRMEKIHKTLCEQFPEDLDVWVGCMEFYAHCRRDDNKVKNTSDKHIVYKRALCKLSAPLQKQFKEKCSHYVLSSTNI